MIKLALVVLLIGSMAIAAAVLTSGSKPGNVHARAASLETDAGPMINPDAMMRSAPPELREEVWPLH